jgi:hypothetical protein
MGANPRGPAIGRMKDTHEEEARGRAALSPRDLRTDRPANLAVLAGVASGIALTVAVIALLVPTGYAGRENPLYWLLMAPVVWWSWATVDFRPWATRLLPWLFAALPLAALLLLAMVRPLGEADRVTLALVAALDAALGVAGWRWWRRSGLRAPRP